MSAWLTTGTVALVPGSPIVTGTGTNWTDVLPGTMFVGPDGVPHQVASLDSVTRLTLAEPWHGRRIDATSYSLVPLGGDPADLPALEGRLSALETAASNAETAIAAAVTTADGAAEEAASAKTAAAAADTRAASAEARAAVLAADLVAALARLDALEAMPDASSPPRVWAAFGSTITSFPPLPDFTLSGSTIALEGSNA